MIKVTFEGQTHSELRTQAIEFFGLGQPYEIVVNPPEVKEEVKPEESKLAEEPKKRHRRTKAEIEAEKNAAKEEKSHIEVSDLKVETAPEIQEELIPTTLDDCKKVLKEIIGEDEAGIPEALHLLSEFKVPNLKALDSKEYANFYNKAREVLDGRR